MGLKSSVAEWWARRWYQRGLEGKEGESVKNFLTQIQGLRSAIIAVLLLVEFLGQHFGFAGPLGYIHQLFSILGWDAKDALFDPTVTGTALLTLYAVYGRFRAWWATRAVTVTSTPAVLPLAKALIVAALLGSSLACGSLAQVRLGAEPKMHPDEKVVFARVCANEENAARLYLESPTFAWIGPVKERYLTDALMKKFAGECPCPGKECPKLEGSK